MDYMSLAQWPFANSQPALFQSLTARELFLPVAQATDTLQEAWKHSTGELKTSNFASCLPPVARKLSVGRRAMPVVVCASSGAAVNARQNKVVRREDLLNKDRHLIGVQSVNENPHR